MKWIKHNYPLRYPPPPRTAGEIVELQDLRNFYQTMATQRLEIKPMVWDQVLLELLRLINKIIDGIPEKERQQWYMDNIKPLTDWIREQRNKEGK